jgi:hypothetical protein
MRLCYIGNKRAICYNINVLKAELFRPPGEKCEVFFSCLSCSCTRVEYIREMRLEINHLFAYLYTMDTEQEKLSEYDHINVISKRDQTLSKPVDEATSTAFDFAQEHNYQKAHVEMLNRMQFGQERERFESDPNQTMLPFKADPKEEELHQQLIKDKLESIRNRPGYTGLAKLPAHLPVEEVEISCQVNLS